MQSQVQFARDERLGTWQATERRDSDTQQMRMTQRTGNHAPTKHTQRTTRNINRWEREAPKVRTVVDDGERRLHQSEIGVRRLAREHLRARERARRATNKEREPG